MKCVYILSFQEI